MYCEGNTSPHYPPPMMVRGQQQQQQQTHSQELIVDNSIHPSLQQLQPNQADYFYDECYREGIPSTDVHAAVIESHRWHQTWRQDSLGPEEPPQPSISDNESGIHYPMQPDLLEATNEESSVLSSNRSAATASTATATSRFQHFQRNKRPALNQSTLSTTTSEDRKREEKTSRPHHSKRRHKVTFATQELPNRAKMTWYNEVDEEVIQTVIEPHAIRPDYSHEICSQFDLRPQWYQQQQHPDQIESYKDLSGVVALQGDTSPLDIPQRCSRPDPMESYSEPSGAATLPGAISPLQLPPSRCSRPSPQDISPLALQPCPQMTTTLATSATPVLVESEDNDIYETGMHNLHFRHSSLSSSDDNLQEHIHVAQISARKQAQRPSAERASCARLPPPSASLRFLQSNQCNTSANDVLKSNFLHALSISSGDVDHPIVKKALLPLVEMFKQQHTQCSSNTVRIASNAINIPESEGMWLTLSKPTYSGNLGPNQDGDPQYTLGRMSFDMFRPTKLVCSLQGIFNHITQLSTDNHSEKTHPTVSTPKSLKDAVREDWDSLKTYNIMTAFTIEPYHPDFPSNSPNIDICRPIRGIMTTYGYLLPDPNVHNRYTVWFTGGKIEPNTKRQDIQDWRKVFASPPERTLGEKAMCLVARMLMGATVPTQINLQNNSSLTYTFTRPIGGHGLAYMDLIYLDDGLRIMRGHKGTIFVFARVPDPKL